MRPAKARVFKVYEQMGEKAGAAAVARRALFVRVVRDAAAGLVDEDDAAEIYARFASSAVGKNSTAVRVSNLCQAIRAAKLADVGFVSTVEAACAAHDEEAGRRRVKPLWEVLVSLAREQLKQPARPLSKAAVIRAFEPFRPSGVAGVLVAIDKLTDDEAREVLAALRKRLHAYSERNIILL